MELVQKQLMLFHQNLKLSLREMVNQSQLPLIWELKSDEPISESTRRKGTKVKPDNTIFKISNTELSMFQNAEILCLFKSRIDHSF